MTETIAAGMKVGRVLDLHPQTLAVFRKHGFGMLGNSVFRAMFSNLVSVEQACAKHGVDVEVFVEELRRAAASEPAATAAATTAQDDNLPVGTSPALRSVATWTGPVRIDMNTLEVVDLYPATREVFAHYFGEACFTCPAFGTEDLEMACRMHGTNPEEFIAACNTAVRTSRAASR